MAIKDLVAKVVDASGRDLKISYDTSKPTLKTSLCLDCSKAKKEFSWSPSHSLDEGIKKTLDWYKTEFEADNKA